MDRCGEMQRDRGRKEEAVLVKSTSGRPDQKVGNFPRPGGSAQGIQAQRG